MRAIITGATKGIGKAIAVALAKKGYDIIGCARNEVELASFETEMKSYDVDVLAIKADLGKKVEVQDFIAKAITFAPQVDVLVNNVGVFYPGSLLDEADDVFEMQQQTNVNATYYIAKSIGKLMREQSFGYIFNICSVASKMPVENAGSYSVTKAAMLSLNNVLRKELAPYHVKVTAIIPGATYTASWEGTTLDKAKFVQPEDVAKAIDTILSLSDGTNVDELTITPSNF
ncbi:SDR family NAD(P)-dependent oxidoreductase [Pedobacter sp. SL55]|uniref:SDR family NAD(P)-dependent oxidoreductase n=1 Tax=Pedobacter sp. SL55 TaxID=2995161 RepID=UPI00226F88B4|nr:SDR family oxidoreductase [Pedobacter sp. SL55]WAC39095.1 SDR family NAD(P)-dependent oxidoreductase [Pedobacter sp. SL55]